MCLKWKIVKHTVVGLVLRLLARQRERRKLLVAVNVHLARPIDERALALAHLVGDCQRLRIWQSTPIETSIKGLGYLRVGVDDLVAVLRRAARHDVLDDRQVYELVRVEQVLHLLVRGHAALQVKHLTKKYIIFLI